MDNSPQSPLTLGTPLKKNSLRKASLRILSSVDANFQKMLKILCSQNVLDHQVAKSLQATMDLQSVCIAKVIQDEVHFLESNRKSFPEDFVDNNVSTFRFWGDCFAGLPVADFSVQGCVPESNVHRALESFMLFLEFYRSVNSVLSTWPIPVGFSYPRSSVALDLFLDLIPTPPTMAYSLAYRPRLSRSELRSVVRGEYCKVRQYISSHLRRVQEATEVTSFDTDWEPCVRLGEKIERRLRKLLQPIQSKLEEVQRKTEELEKTDFGLDLQAERVYASQQVQGAEVLVRTFNDQLQQKTSRYMSDFHLQAKGSLASARSVIRSRFQRRTATSESQDCLKSNVLDMMDRWDEALDHTVQLNRGGILEILTNVHHVRAEITAFIDSLI